MGRLNVRAPLTSLTIRQCREALGLCQAGFAHELGVPLETYRTWDSGRRPVRPEILIQGKRACPAPRLTRAAPSRHPRPADPCPRAYAVRGGHGWATSGH